MEGFQAAFSNEGISLLHLKNGKECEIKKTVFIFYKFF